MWKALLLSAAIVASVSAHFEVLYTPEVEVNSKTVNITNYFSHPYDGNPLMESGRSKDGKTLPPLEVFMVYKGKKIDLSKDAKPVQYKTDESKGTGYDFTLSKDNGFRGAGDYAVFMVPSPYWEPAEDLYIQQITKIFINKGGFGTGDWSKKLTDNYTEIIPLVNPYYVISGGIFRAKVLDNSGNPVEGATVEIEYLNSDVDMANHTIGKADKISNDKHGTAFVVTDVNGIFSFIPPKDGMWGFAALSAGSDKKFNGNELEQDPVIWIKVTK